MIYFEGDLVVGNPEADVHYGITVTGSEWQIVNRMVGNKQIPYTEKDTMIDVCLPKYFHAVLEQIKEEGYPTHEVFTVRKDCFDLVSGATGMNKLRSKVLERYDD